MNTNNYAFNYMSGITVEEIYDGCHLFIEPGGFCTFNEKQPSNGLHYHNCYELCYVTAGKGEFLHGQTIYKLREGDVFIANPRVAHEIKVNRIDNSAQHETLELVFFIINIYTQIPASILPEDKIINSFLKDHDIAVSGQPQLLCYLEFIKNYSTHCTNQRFGVYYAIKSMVLECLRILSKTQENTVKKDLTIQSTLDLATHYISMNLDKKMLLKDVAKHACTSERNLQYLFRRHINKTVIEFINERRISVSTLYLKMNFKVSDVGPLIGIEDPSQFSRLFKKFMNESPKKFQKKHSSGDLVKGAVHLPTE